MKVKNDHRSEFSNLSNWKEEAWKKSGPVVLFEQPYLLDYPPSAPLVLESGRLFEAGRLSNFQHFQQVWYVYFATDTCFLTW